MAWHFFLKYVFAYFFLFYDLHLKLRFVFLVYINCPYIISKISINSTNLLQIPLMLGMKLIYIILKRLIIPISFVGQIFAWCCVKFSLFTIHPSTTYSLFAFPQPLCLVFQGYFSFKVWFQLPFSTTENYKKKWQLTKIFRVLFSFCSEKLELCSNFLFWLNEVNEIVFWILLFYHEKTSCILKVS